MTRKNTEVELGGTDHLALVGGDMGQRSTELHRRPAARAGHGGRVSRPTAP